MSSLDKNKIAASVLIGLMLAWITGILAEKIVVSHPLKQNVYIVQGVEPAATAETGGAAAGPEPLGPLLASADINAGKEVAKKCATCHTFDKGGANRVGPNLYGTLGSEIGEGHAGFAFSNALKDKHATWTVETLNEWLFKPQAFAKGTKMTFVGLPKAKDRADMIAYLNSLSDAPKPLQ